MVAGTLIDNSYTHWNITVQALSFNVMKVVINIDSALFE